MFLHADSEYSEQTGQIWSLRWAHRSFCWFCHVAAQIVWIFFVLQALPSDCSMTVIPFKSRAVIVLLGFVQ